MTSSRLSRAPLASAAFRFALALALVLATGAAALLWAVERQVDDYALGATRQMLHGEAQELTIKYEQSGRQGLLRALARHAGVDQGRQFHYLLLDARGRRLFGDLDPGSVRIGAGRLTSKEGDKPTVMMRQLGVRLNGGLRLYIATDTYGIETLRDRLVRFTVLSGFAICFFALVGGYGVGRVFLRRLDKVNRTVERIISGDGIERLPPIGFGSEFDTLTRNLNRMLERITASMEGLRQVSTAVAHELRTPLMRLQQRIERLQVADPTISCEGNAALAEINDILDTFEALLRIGLIEGGAGRDRFTIVPISDLLSRLCETFAPVAEDAAQELSADITPRLSAVGDAQLLTQMFSNLVENAIVHTPSGTWISVELREQEKGEIVATVRDDGPGIAPDDSERVFQRFYRGAASRDRPGTGLGLSLVAAIAHLHDASCRILPQPRGFAIEIVFH